MRFGEIVTPARGPSGGANSPGSSSPRGSPPAGGPGAGTVTVRVGGEAPYDVVVGRGVGDALAPMLAGAHRVAVLHAPPLAAAAGTVADALVAAGAEPHLLPVPDGEAGKTVAVAAECWDALGAAGFTRSDAVVGVGGGAVTDLAGFVAAAWLRGVRWAAVPTSLLGMVDAAVGGKTGVDTAAGKNLVGAFHPPAGVVADLDTLATLPPAERTAGLAEVVKCGFIADPRILELIEGEVGPGNDPAAPADPAASADPAGAAGGGPADPAGAVLPELVTRAVRVKADVVTADLREEGGTGGREILNYGHTLAHAIEQVEQYQWRHGEAVAVGLVYAAALARRAGRLDPDTARRHRRVLAALGLPTTYRADAWPALRAAMAVDKKARGATLRFVVLDGLARPGILQAPDESLLTEAYREVAR